MRDTLFVYRPRFDEKGITYFCPYSAQVIGYLTYFPAVRESLDIIELDFTKPREPLARMLDPDHQAAPILVLGGDRVDVPNVKFAEAGGHWYVEKTIEILRYLAATRSTPVPH
jgi:hypothetical protein